MSDELRIRNVELGIPIHPPCGYCVSIPDGWAAFLIPTSYLLISDSRTRGIH
jgi:hypothetical protein